MNAKEAKEIVSNPENYSDIGPLGWGQVIHAQGYLEAHDKAKKLADALESLVRNDGVENYQWAVEVLEEWRIENGLVKPSPEK